MKNTILIGVLASMIAATPGSGAPREVTGATHITVRHEKGRCLGWPANGGIWSWGNEILVQYKNGVFVDKPPGSHDFDFNQPVANDQSRSLDGGLTWTKEARVSRLVDPAKDVHDVALMPSTVRVSATKLVTCIRNLILYPKVGWIDCRFSNDNGKTWRLQSIPVNDEAGTTPPALVRLADGRLALSYGYRRPLEGPTSIRARISEDQGATWGEELILRTGGGDEDIGYTRSVVRPDGKIVTIYYWQEDEKAERDIAATIWTPPAPTHTETQAVPFAYGFEAMERTELLPFFLPNGTQTKQFITYDPAGQNRSGFFKRYEENGEYVFFDEIGPGCLYRQQMNVFVPKYTKFPNEEIRIRYYFDDEPKPRIDMTFAEFFGKGGNYTPPFTPPLAYFDLKQWGNGPGAFAVLYYPFTFQKRLKISAYHASGMKWYRHTWFQYTYLKYPPGTGVRTWKGRELDSPALRAQWERVGEDPKGSLAGESLKATNAIASGGKAMVLDLKGQGAIGALRLRLEPWTREIFLRARIRITWDDEPGPAVDMSLGSFFGAGGDTIGVEDVSGKTLKTLFFGFDAKSREFYSYWPMPYWSRAQVEIVNDSPTDITKLVTEVTSLPPNAIRYPAGACGYFHAKRTIDISPDAAIYSRAFRERGRGKVVGLTMYSTGYNMDGDEFTFIDNSLTPQIHGDGTEDDHNQGWGGYAIQKPLWGGLINGFQGAYRFYLGEPYIFDSSIRIHYEHSNLGSDDGQKTDFVVWYYLESPGVANLRLTDEIDIGNDASERAHRCTASGVKWSETTASSYDRYEQQELVPTTTDAGRVFTETSEFTVKLDPANEGVKLRRRVNRLRANVQRANVRVDGQLIPDAPWYLCDLPLSNDKVFSSTPFQEVPADHTKAPEAAFRDVDYEIPAQYTRGKSEITIRIEHVHGWPENSSNEYHYWIYCYGRTPVPAQPLLELGPMSAVHTHESAVELGWVENMDGVGHVRIQRRAEGEIAFKTIGTVAAGTTVFQDTTFPPFARCAYRIQAFNEVVESEPSLEVVILTPAGPGLPNLARGAKASASSSRGKKFTPDMAIDGRHRSQWSSASGAVQEWLELDLGRESEVAAVILFQDSGGTRISAYAIQAMVKGQWKDVYGGLEMPDAAVCRFDPVVTSRVRLLVKSARGENPGIREMCVFGKTSKD